MSRNKRTVVLGLLCLVVVLAGCTGGDDPAGTADDGDTPGATTGGESILNVGSESDGTDRYVYLEPEQTIPESAFLSVTPDSPRYGSIGSGLGGELTEGQRYYISGFQDASLELVSNRSAATPMFEASDIDEPVPVEVTVTLENDTEFNGTTTVQS